MIMLLASDERFSKVNLMGVKNLIAYKTIGECAKFFNKY